MKKIELFRKKVEKDGKSKNSEGKIGIPIDFPSGLSVPGCRWQPMWLIIDYLLLIIVFLRGSSRLRGEPKSAFIGVNPRLIKYLSTGCLTALIIQSTQYEQRTPSHGDFSGIFLTFCRMVRIIDNIFVCRMWYVVCRIWYADDQIVNNK